MLYKIEKPPLEKLNQEKLFELFVAYQDNKDGLASQYQATIEPEYLYWDKIRFKSGIPPNVKMEEFWHLVKFIRRAQSVETVLTAESGQKFSWLRLPGLERFLHEVDLNMGGNLFALSDGVDDTNRYKFISRGVMEEAIASSQLEGAHTTREAAKQMLREGRKPRNNSERMILNNYRAMRTIEAEYKDRKISLETIFQLHAMLTKDTINPDQQGRFRKDTENIIVGDDAGVVYHIPPKRAFVEQQMNALIAFANDEPEQAFLHPIIKAIMLHFWIGYLHPFTDGNGRLARAMFYWYLMSKNYWAFGYLPISRVIKKSPVQYGMAYVYAEQDDLDLTYFLDYNLRKIKMAVKEFDEYLRRKAKENAQMNKLSKLRYNFNDRQIQLLQFFNKNKDHRTSITIHMNVNQVSRATSNTDIQRLAATGFIKPRKVGKHVYYYATEKVDALFR